MTRRKPTIKDPIFAAIERPLTDRVDTCYTLEDSIDLYQNLNPSNRALVQDVDLRKIKILNSRYDKRGKIRMDDETINFPQIKYGGYFVITDNEGQSTLKKYKTLENALIANPELYKTAQTSKELVREVIVDSNLIKQTKREERRRKPSSPHKYHMGGAFSSTTERIDG